MITENQLVYLLIGIASFSIILLTLFLYLFIQRLRQNRFEHKIQTYIKNHMDEWNNYLLNEQAEVSIIPSPSISSADKTAIDRIFSHYVQNIKDEDILDKIAHYAQLNLQKFYLKKLHSKNWGERISTLHKISDFKMSFLVPEVEHLLLRSKKLTRSL